MFAIRLVLNVQRTYADETIARLKEIKSVCQASKRLQQSGKQTSQNTVEDILKEKYKILHTDAEW